MSPFIHGGLACSFYLAEGFLHLQNAVSLAIIEDTAQTNISLKISVEVRYTVCDIMSQLHCSNSTECVLLEPLQQFPYPPFLRDFFLVGAGLFIPTVVMIAFIYSFGSLVKVYLLSHSLTRIPWLP